MYEVCFVNRSITDSSQPCWRIINRETLEIAEVLPVEDDLILDNCIFENYSKGVILCEDYCTSYFKRGWSDRDLWKKATTILYFCEFEDSWCECDSEHPYIEGKFKHCYISGDTIKVNHTDELEWKSEEFVEDYEELVNE